MSNALDNIFNSIYLSEQESKTQHEYLSNIKSQIFNSEKEIREIEQMHHDLLETIAKKIKRLSNREVTLKTLKIRNDLLNERINELNSEKELLLKNQAELKAELHSMSNRFCTEAANFDEEIGFSKRRSKPAYTSGKFAKYENLTEAFSIEGNKTGVKSDVKRDESEIEGFDGFLFDVDFNCSQLE
ncbi:hypothetical protein JTE90_009386 [Oedothorax gibbosus]|uniref:Coiled-coil domain-containing protein 172 n=1 Tax=Oedothorax gibbosus TaxID=931172 RepID=A0AAV6VSB8_9ARAC|nr:hypothetical protein JTE90_009386 [Oedothorax gibbosus]